MKHSGKTAAAAMVLATVLAVSIGTTGSGASAQTSPGTDVLEGHTMDSQPIPCTTRDDGVRVCSGDITGPGGTDLRLESFDGTPLSVYVTLPPVPESGEDGNYPLIVQSHGWGKTPSGPDDTQYGGPSAAEWAKKGYAVVQLTARGWGSSCGSAASREVNPAACERGYIRLDDVRYEGRDIQNTIGLLVDEGIVDPQRIGLTGESYGSGSTLEIATLDDRIIEEDGSLSPWTSPEGTPLSIAAAVPLFGWSDLFYSLMPNGRTLDAGVTPTDELSIPGIWKLSIGSGLFLVGESSGYYSPKGTDPEADIRTWFEVMSSGGPYGEAFEQIGELNTRYHSPYYLLDGTFDVERQPPPPLLLVGGFTDAVFPADEQLRYYNLHHELYPDEPISLLFYDGGHQRAQNKTADAELLAERVEAFLDHYVGGNGPEPAAGVTALSQTCPMEAPSGGPFEADTWSDLHPGEVRFASSAPQQVRSDAGDQAVAAALEPVLGGLACTTVPAVDQGHGVATYRLPAATGEGYTMLGAPSITADVETTGSGAYLAARLFDVDPASDTATLVARGEYQIDPAAPGAEVTFQLHANAWHFAEGHIPKLELLGQDTQYLRPSNGQFTVTVTNLELQIPVNEVPGEAGTPAEVAEFTALQGTHTATPAAKTADESNEAADESTNTALILVVVLLACAGVIAVVLVTRSARRRSA